MTVSSLFVVSNSLRELACLQADIDHFRANYARSSNDFSQTIGCETYEQPDQRLGMGPLPGCSHAPFPG
jgi:hypothetical protein